MAFAVTLVVALAISTAYAIHQETPTLPEDPGTVTQSLPDSAEVALLKSIDAKIGKLVFDEPDFFLLYRVTHATIECQDTSKNVHLYNHHKMHNNNDDDFFNWDGTVQYGGIKHEGSRISLPFFIYEMELDNGEFHGKGILHGKSPLCPESKNVFEISVSGKCDGSEFRLGGLESGTYNVTVSEFDVLCVEK